MLKYKVGNLVSAALVGEVHATIDQRNCQGVMRSGIAKELAERIPGLEQNDKDFCLTLSRNPQGAFGLYSSYKYNNVEFFGVYGQLLPSREGRQTNYGALASGLCHVRNWLYESIAGYSKDTKIGIPKIGCGVAKGDWIVVSELVEFIFKDFDVTVYVLDEKEIPPGATRV